MVLGWLAGRAHSSGGISKPFLVGWLGSIIFANIAYRAYIPPAPIKGAAPSNTNQPTPEHSDDRTK